MMIITMITIDSSSDGGNEKNFPLPPDWAAPRQSLPPSPSFQVDFDYDDDDDDDDDDYDDDNSDDLKPDSASLMILMMMITSCLQV